MKKQNYAEISEQLAGLNPEQAAALILQFVEDEAGQLDAQFLQELVESPPPRDELIQNYALRGSGAAQVALGMRIIGNKDRAEKASEGVFWLARASANGNGQADHLLGTLYATGQVLEQNILKAEDHLLKAAHLNLPKAQYMLGVLYLDDENGLYDEHKAKHWLQKSHDQGNEKATELLASL